MWNPFVDRVDANSETLNGRSNRHRQLLDDNLKWQRQAEELAGRHEQRIAHLEEALEERDIYISNIESMLAELSGKVSDMEGNTGGEGQYTQWVHCELIVGPETIHPAHTQWVNSGHIQKVPTHLPSPNPGGKLWALLKSTHQFTQ